MKTPVAAELIDLVERHYFRNVDSKNLELVLKCFAGDSVLRVQTADVTHRGRDGEIRRIFANLMKNTQTIYHGEFSHVVDVENQEIASEFLVRNSYDDGRHVEKRNCNLFEIQSGLLKDVSVYMTGENTLV
jgi:ketosteroid isomerase-like protein